MDETALTIIPKTQIQIVEDTDPRVLDKPLVDQWLHGKSAKTKAAYRADLERFYQFAGISLASVNLGDLQRFEDSLSDLATSSRARMLATLKSALTFANKLGALPVNAGALLKLPKIPDTLAERILSEQQVQRMLFVSESHPRNHAIISLLYHAGLRDTELCNLKWRHLQQRNETGQIMVFGKGEKTRFILLDDETTWNDLQVLKRPGLSLDAYVFESRQRKSRKSDNPMTAKMDESTVYGIVREVARQAGIPEEVKVSPHWLRHCHATHAIENGAPITLVQATLGHASIKTTARYTHVRPNASSTRYLKV